MPRFRRREHPVRHLKPPTEREQVEPQLPERQVVVHDLLEPLVVVLLVPTMERNRLGDVRQRPRTVDSDLGECARPLPRASPMKDGLLGPRLREGHKALKKFGA